MNDQYINNSQFNNLASTQPGSSLHGDPRINPSNTPINYPGLDNRNSNLRPQMNNFISHNTLQNDNGKNIAAIYNHQSPDIIQNLPIDSSNPNKRELLLINKLFDNKYSHVNIPLFDRIKSSIILFGIYFIISLSLVTNLINSYIPISNSSSYSLIAIKAIIFIIIINIIDLYYN